MIKSITITNNLDQSITIVLGDPSTSGFLIDQGGITGLGPPKADIDTTELSATDGAAFNSARARSRNIVFHIGLDDSGKETIETLRQKTYKYFPIKQRIKIQIETTNRTCETYGMVESNEPDIFAEHETCVISVICPSAYLYSGIKQTTSFSYVTPLFEFPFSNESFTNPLLEMGDIQIHTTKSIYYLGEAPIGIVMHIHAIGPVLSDIVITNLRTLETMSISSTRIAALTGAGIQAGDEIVVSTVIGDKYANLIRNGVTTNIRNALGKYPDWFQLEVGNNVFTYTAVDGLSNLQFIIENQVAYQGA